jgi:hypothetical protein
MMNVRRKYLLRMAVGCIVSFALTALAENPLIPDVCTSMGYGHPFPVYISWCECFTDNPQPAINVAYLSLDLILWIGLWLLLNLIFYRNPKSGKCAKHSTSEG